MKKIIILIPLYNDWQSVAKLLKEIDLESSNWDAEISIIIINDASTQKISYLSSNYKKIKSVKIINMKKNMGHAKCNATGLKHINEKEDFHYVFLMDADGEDRPEELNLLYKKSKENPNKVVTANRVKRSEGPLFRSLYEMHKFLTYICTGKLVKFGNYSCLPKEAVTKLIKEPSIWNSFSGTVTKIFHDRVSIPSFRGKRYFGPSKMNLLKLVVHSFSIIAVFKNTMTFRSVVFLIIYLFFIYNHLSIFTLFPALVLIIFILLIFKISCRESDLELNKSLENIDTINILSNLDSR